MLDKDAIASELSYKAVRSSGSGGQHVNKVATKVELHFNVMASKALSDVQLSALSVALSKRINKQGVLVMSCDDSRSQLRNKTLVTKRFFELMENSLKRKKERKETTIPKVIKQKRLDLKRKQSEKKSQRKPPKID